MDKADVVVVGGGAAGLMAALCAAEGPGRVLLLEKNEKLGKKLYITGKGRCNFTNACDTEEIFPQVVTNAKFLYSSIYGFTNFDVIRQFEEWGLPVKEERGGRMFPVSDKASDVTRVLERVCRERGVEIALGQEVSNLRIDSEQGAVTGVTCRDGRTIEAKCVILATGGVSYPSTGSTGDGYRMAEACGHRIVAQRPGLTGLTTKESFVRDLQGLTLLHTAQTLWDETGEKRKKVSEGFGELLFTHFGVSGPFVLTASSRLGDMLAEHPLRLEMDIKPALTEKQLDERLLREIGTDGKKSVGNLMNRLLPKSLIPVLLKVAGVDPAGRALDLTRADRQALVREMKSFSVTVTGTRGFEEAIITRGGVSVKDVNPHSMESKIISGLYFAGEVLDVDALTGGFNLQIAWSTGHSAGEACKEALSGG